MGGQRSDAAKIYLDQTSQTAKNKTISTIAVDKMRPENYSTFTSLMSQTEPVTKFRDKLSHWAPFGKQPIVPFVDNQITSDLLLFDPVKYYKNKKPNKVAGFFKFSKQELNYQLDLANEIGIKWMEFAELVYN